MRIPESKIEEIRNSVDIVDVISQHVQLRKRGKNFIGLCPFHSEKTPSFTVSEEKQIFHCFGCHTGGNVFKFLTEFHKISFVEAVQELAEQQGITIEFDKAEYTEQQSEQEVLYDINTEAARYFLNNLLNDAEGEVARKYLHERNIKTQTLRTFGLGYALRGWENFISYAKSRNLNIDKCIQLGLVGKTSEGKLYDKLPGRLIFPIFSPNGRVVAFAGRVLDPKDTGAKYINSPESLIYIKGRILYGLSFAKDDIRRLDKAIIVEGYMDLISLYQSGIKNVVAVSGTALTDDQVQLLSRYTKNVVLLFDADVAGIKASMRSIEILLKRDMEIKIVSLPKGEDPDSFVNKFGKEEFEELVKKAENFLEYQLKYYEKEGMFIDPTSSSIAIREIVRLISFINDDLRRSLLLKIAKKFNLREKLLENELSKVLIKTQNEIETRTRTSLSQKKVTDELSQPSIAFPKSKKNYEDDIIMLLLNGNADVVNYIIENVSVDEIESDLHKRVFDVIMTIENVGNVELILKNFKDENEQTLLRSLIMGDYSISQGFDDRFPSEPDDTRKLRYCKETVKSFRLSQIDLKIHKIIQKLNECAPEDELLLLIEKENLEEVKRKIKREILI